MKSLARFFSYLLKTTWKILPFSFNRFCAKILSILWVDIFQIRRKVIYDNLNIAFPNIKPDQLKKIAQESMTNFCRSFFDVIQIPNLTDAWIDQNVEFIGLENLEKAKSQNKGILFLTLHMGSGDLAAAIISRKLINLALITKHFSNIFADEFWFSLRRQSKTVFIDAHSQRNAFDILSQLKKKNGVIFVLDQFMGKPYGLETEFFGKKTGTAYGLALFAKKTKAPVVPIFTYWKNERLVIVFEPEVDLTKAECGSDENILKSMTNLFNNRLEIIIQKYPEHWMWVHRRWKEFE